MTQDKRLTALLDKQDIYELMCRYCRGVDRMDKDLTLSCFWPGAIDVHVGKNGVYHGSVEEFLEAEWESWKVFTGSQHHLCNHLCEVDGDQAIAETYQFSLYWAAPGDDPALNILNSNRYLDRFEKRDGEWRIMRRELFRNFSFSIRPVAFPTSENGWPMQSRDRNDPAYRTIPLDHGAQSDNPAVQPFKSQV